MNAAATALPDRVRRGRARRRTPLVLQSEQHECGLACLAMVAAHHGREESLAALRARAGDGGRGSRLAELLAVARGLGLRGRALRLEPEELSSLRTPAILHWDLDHFVVLERSGRRHVTVLDPARGRRRLQRRELDGHLTGIALELVPGVEFTPGGERPRMRLREFWSRSAGLGRSIATVLVLSLALQLLALASPFYVQLVVDEALVKHDALLLKVLVLGFAAVAVLRTLVTWVRGRLVLHLGELVGFQMQGNLLHHLLRLPLPWFERRQLGDVVSRFGSLAPVQGLLTDGAAVGLVDGVMAAATLAMMLLYSPALAGVVLAAVAAYASVRLVSLPRLRELQQASIAAAADEETVFLETLRCVGTLKAFGREGERHALWQNRHARTVNARVDEARRGLLLGAVNGLLFGAENLLVVYLGANRILEGAFTVGMLYAFVAFKGQFTDRMVTLLDQGAQFLLLRLHLERLAEIGHAEPETGPTPAPALRRGQARIALVGASFRFGPAAPPLLEDLDLTVPPGGLTVISGPSGCGKSTLLRLLCGLAAPTAGHLEIDGRRVEAGTLDAWRRRTGVVLQDDHLFTGSLAENVTLFDPEPDPERLERCAEETGLAPLLAMLPLGWQTRLGEEGAGLSGGQRQRLVLARALYARPDALFLDEATAHLDAESAAAVAARIRALPMTRVVVTHDPGLFGEPDLALRFRAPGVLEVHPCGGAVPATER